MKRAVLVALLAVGIVAVSAACSWADKPSHAADHGQGQVMTSHADMSPGPPDGLGPDVKVSIREIGQGRDKQELKAHAKPTGRGHEKRGRGHAWGRYKRHKKGNGDADVATDFSDVRVDMASMAEPVPEPSSLVVIGGGLVALAGIIRRKR